MLDRTIIQSILTHFDRERDSARGQACGLAYCFIEAARQSQGADTPRWQARMPTFAQTLACLDDTPVQAIVLRSLDIAREVSDFPPSTLDDRTPWEGAVVIFEDLTGLWFDGEILSEYEMNLADATLEFPTLFARDSRLQVVAASHGFKMAHGSPETWRRSLPENFEEIGETDIHTLILIEIEDLVDPPCESVDMSDQSNWSAQDEVALRETLTLAWLAMQVPCGVEITLHTAWQDCTHEKEASLFAHSDTRTVESQELILLYFELLDGLDDFDRYQGCEWEYNDGARDRLSGYSPYPVVLLSLDIDPDTPSISSHQKIGARPIIHSRLEARGWECSRIDDLFARIDRAAQD